MRITLVVVGKISERFFEDAIKEYTKRLQRFCQVNIVEVKDEKTKENASKKEIDLVKDKEGERILSKISDSSYVICLAINGEALSSEELSEKMSSLITYGRSDVTFVIGGSLGLADSVLNRADYKLSFSKMTFPHQLMRVILLEQVYRAFKIMNKEPYHK